MIHAPRLMPDESAAAYWGRVLRLNAVPEAQADEAAFSKRARRQTRANGEDESSQACLIGTVAGAPLATVIRSHTLVPLWGAVVSVVNLDWCDGSFQSRELQQRALSGIAHYRALCPMCVSEDVDYWGFSYWRRSHQIPTVAWCQKHGCPLFRARGNDSWQEMPHEALADARPESPDVAKHSTENPVLRRYAEICNELLQRSRPFSTAQVLRALVKRARFHGLEGDPRAQGRRLSDLAADLVTGPWQAVFWKELSAKPAGEHLPALDGVLSRLRAGLGIQSYALAIALLYDSVDQALWDIDRALPPMRALDAAIDVEATRPVRNEPPRTPDDDARQRERLRQAVTLVLSGTPVHFAARCAKWAPEKLERMLAQCLTAECVDELCASNRAPTSSYG